MAELPKWVAGEEFANSATHGIAAVFFAIASLFIIRKSIFIADASRVVGMSFFCTAAVETYTASALYHGLANIRIKRIMRFVDHCSVYSLIASSYTAYALTGLREHGGFIFLPILWAIAIAGSIGKLFFFDIVDRYTVLIYVGMGWIVTISIRSMYEALALPAFSWLIAGGLSYTAGTYFYSRKRPFDHTIFHLFIIGGTVCHAISLHFYV
jgi:hemolysin III